MYFCIEKINFDFKGWWSATHKNRGRSKRKSRGGSFAVGTYL